MHRPSILLLLLLLAPGTATAWLHVQSGQQADNVLFVESGDLVSGGSITTMEDALVVVKHQGGTGIEQWRYLLVGGPLNRRHVALARDAAGAIFASGRYEVGRDGPFVSYVAKLASGDGSEAWRIELPDAGIYAINVDDTGDLVLAGAVRGAQGVATQDLLVVKLDGTSGVELWRHIKNGIASNADTAFVGAFNSRGDVVAGGAIFDNAALGYPDFFVVQLSGIDGSEIWRHTIPSVAAHGGRVEALTLDQDGNVIAAGQAVTGSGWCDWVVAKLDVADGSELWRAVFDGGGCDKALAVEVDLNGDVVATGARGLTLFVTMKFSGADGSLLWRHDIQNMGQCTGGGCAVGKAIRVNADGDALVAGSDPSGDFIIAKLDADSGAEAWRRAIDFDGCGDSPAALAVDAGGRVAISGQMFAQVDDQCAWPNGGHYAVLKLTASGKDYWGGCQDEMDNDGDGFIDFPSDVDCLAPEDGSEGPDMDEDNVLDELDNCVATANGGQTDSDQDGFGNACDADYDNDGAAGGTDYFTFLSTLGKSLGDPGYLPEADSDGDDAITGSDYFFVLEELGTVPGPSGLACAGSPPCPGSE